MRNLDADDGSGATFWLPLPAPALIAHIVTPRQSGSSAGRIGLRSFVGELDAHDDAVVLEDLAELAELDLLVEPGEVLGHRGPGRPVARRAGLARQHRKNRPPSSQRHRQHAERGGDVGEVEQPAVRVDRGGASSREVVGRLAEDSG